MGSELAEQRLYTPDDLKRRISDSVRATVGMLFPEEQWDVMIEKEIKAYFEDVAEAFEIVSVVEKQNGYSGYSSTENVRHKLARKVTPFRAQVWRAISEQLNNKIDAFFQSDAWKVVINQMWDNDTQSLETKAQLSAELDKKLEGLAPKLVGELFRAVFANGVQLCRNSLLDELRSSTGLRN